MTQITVFHDPDESHLDTPEVFLPRPFDSEKILPSIDKYNSLLEDFKNRTSDRICLEIAEECDRLRVIFEYENDQLAKKSTDLASIVAKRINALKLLSERFENLEKNQRVSIEIAAVTSVVRHMKDVMRDLNIPAETRELILQGLVRRISDDHNT